MHFANYTLQDILGTLFATLVFTTLLYTPGYLLAFATNFFGFRRMAFPERSLWAIATSFIAVPIAAYFSARTLGLNITCGLFAATAVVTIALLLKPSALQGFSPRDRRITAILVAAVTLFVLLMLIDLQVGHKLYFSVVMCDQSYRIALTDAIARTGVPPANPLYFPGAPAPLHYYYFWYILTAAVEKIAHVSPQQAFTASSIWAGFGLLATVSLFTRHFFHWERRQRYLALALLAVTGADLLPALGQLLLQPSINGDIEWWSVDPIDAWPDSLLWVPHHVAAALCCLLAFLFLWRTREALTRSTKNVAIAMATLACASAFGLSIYVAFGFAVMMTAWLIRLWVTRAPNADPDRTALSQRLIIIGVASTLLLLPFLRELTNATHPHVPTQNLSSRPEAAGRSGETGSAVQPPPTPTTHLFTLSVRRMIDSGLLTSLPVFTGINQHHSILLDQAIRLLLLLPGLAMELGLFGAVWFLLLRARRRKQLPPDPARDTALFLVLSGIVMTLFLSSSVMTNNDFGYRSVMLPQFFLTLLTAEVLGSWWFANQQLPSQTLLIPKTRATRATLYALLALGVAGSLYGAIILRAWLPLEEHRPQDGFSQLASDEYEARTAYATLNRVAAPNAVLSFRPIDAEDDRKDMEVMSPNEYFQRMMVMDAPRQVLTAEPGCAANFGGDPTACPAIETATNRLFAQPTPSAADAQTYCARFGVQYLVVSHRDAIWSTTGWATELPTIAAQPNLRVLQCAVKSLLPLK